LGVSIFFLESETGRLRNEADYFLRWKYRYRYGERIPPVLRPCETKPNGSTCSPVSASIPLASCALLALPLLRIKPHKSRANSIVRIAVQRGREGGHCVTVRNSLLQVSSHPPRRPARLFSHDFPQSLSECCYKRNRQCQLLQQLSRNLAWPTIGPQADFGLTQPLVRRT
jgi:hypothetical protein